MILLLCKRTKKFHSCLWALLLSSCFANGIAEPLVLDDSLNCQASMARAALEKKLARIPDLTASYLAQAEPDPASGIDRTRQRIRVGLGFDLQRLDRASDFEKIALSNCGSASSRTSLMQKIELTESSLDYLGALASKEVLTKALAAAESRRTQQTEMERSGLISQKDFDLYLEALATLQMKALERNKALTGINVVNALPDPVALQTQTESMFAQEAKVRRLQDLRSAGDAWNLKLSGGYETLRPEKKERAAVPAYLVADFRWNLGFLGEHDQQFNADQMQAMQQADPLFAKIKSMILKLKSDRQDWQRLLVVAQTRLADIEALQDKEEKFSTKSQRTNHWATYVNKANWAAIVAELEAKLAATSEWTALKPVNALAAPGAAKQGTAETDASEPDPRVADNAVRTKSSLANPALPTKGLGDGHYRYYNDNPTMRMKSFVASANEVDLMFRYLGPTQITVPLGDGERRNQFGVFLAAKNQCNMLYVMVRVGPDNVPKVVVQKKHNIGQSTHDQCENRGYSFVHATQTFRPVPKMNINEDHRMKAVIDESFSLVVTIDGHKVWQGPVPKEGLSLKDALVGVRSDNAKLAFDLMFSPSLIQDNLNKKGILFEKIEPEKTNLKSFLPNPKVPE